jgi:hypothetical protein
MTTLDSKEKVAMTLTKLKERVDATLENRRGRELTVCIPNNKGGMGGTSVTNAVSAHSGIDWDSGKFFIYPEVKMIDMPPAYKDSEYQEALQKIRTLRNAIQMLVDVVEAKDEKIIPLKVKFCKTVLERIK